MRIQTNGDGIWIQNDEFEKANFHPKDAIAILKNFKCASGEEKYSKLMRNTRKKISHAGGKKTQWFSFLGARGGEKNNTFFSHMTSSKIPTSLKNILKAFRLYSPNIFSSECDFSLNIIILLPWIRYHIFPLKKLLYDFFSAYYLSLQCVPHTHLYSNTRHLKVTNWTKTQIFFWIHPWKTNLLCLLFV